MGRVWRVSRLVDRRPIWDTKLRLLGCSASGCEGLLVQRQWLTAHELGESRPQNCNQPMDQSQFRHIGRNAHLGPSPCAVESSGCMFGTCGDGIVGSPVWQGCGQNRRHASKSEIPRSNDTSFVSLVSSCGQIVRLSVESSWSNKGFPIAQC